jgi:hypothetical protein
VDIALRKTADADVALYAIKRLAKYSPPRDDDLEVLAWYNEGVFAAAIHPLKQLDNFRFQGDLLC